MRIQFTVDSRGRQQDVELRAPDDATLADVGPALFAALSTDPGSSLWLADRLLAPDATLTGAGVRAGSLLATSRSSGDRARAGVVSLQVVGGRDAGRTVGLERGRLHIGRDPSCDLVLDDVDASRRHAVVEVGAHAITLRDLGSTNGTRVDGRPVDSGGCALRAGCVIAIGDSLLTVAGPSDPPASVQPSVEGGLILMRPPRRRYAVPADEIELPVRPNHSRPRGVQWVTALLPAVAGGAIAWIAHSPQFLLFALLSPVMMLSTALGDRLHWRRSRRRDAATFRQRRADAERRIVEALERETNVRRAAAPDPATVLGAVTLPSCRVWERRRGDADFLQPRLGSGDLPSSVRTRTGATTEAAGTVTAVPLTVDLREGPLGLAGPADVVAASGRSIVGQLAALHSPADLEVALLLGPGREDDWAWARWLPHVRSRAATTDDGWVALAADLSERVERRRRSHRSETGAWPGQWLVLVVDRASRLSDAPGLSDVLAQGASVGIAAVCIDVDTVALPKSCATVVRVCGDTGSRIVVQTDADVRPTSGVLDGVSTQWAETVARALAPLTDGGDTGTASLPDSCGLADVLDLGPDLAAAIDRRWASSTAGATTSLGYSRDGRLPVDLVRDGPHALVAGTTGSGKSELLQGLVAGLAVNHPPSDVNFLLIDYKGGAAFADCARLPHTAGLVTDLDPYLTERALRSLHSELRRRERVFATAGAVDLPAYRAARPAEPVARLIIVVDEFASLAEELPDFVRGLVGVAQRGRSLGVHLVLATQRPGRAVSPEIRANTALRIALRVTDPGESTDVIDAPDAALIERAFPGRAYLRAGSLLTCFQAAHVGATARPDPTSVSVELLGPWRGRVTRFDGSEGPTDISRVVDAVCAVAQRTGCAAAHSPWLPPLPPELSRTAMAASIDRHSVVLGRVDLPDEQRCTPLAVDLAGGSSLLAAGAGRSGRSGVLASLALGAAEQLAPSLLNVHIVDARGELAGALRPLPHTATVLGPDDASLAPRLFRRLERECARRVSASPVAGRATERPMLLLLVDGWDALTAALGDVDAADCSESLSGLLRSGPAAGLSVAVTGDRTVLTPRFSSGFTERIVLRMPDRSDYGLVGISTRDVPSAMPPGRALRAGDGAVLQIAHAGDAPDAEGLRRSVADIAARHPSPGIAPDAIRIRPLPARVMLRDLPPCAGVALGLAGDQSQPLAFDPFSGAGRVLVAGPARSGRTTVLRSIVAQAHAAGIATVVAAPERSALAGAARDLAVRVIAPSDDDVGPVPATRTLLLVDDSEVFTDTAAGERLTAWVRSSDAPLAAVVAGRADDLATTYRGVAADVRRSHCGILLRPGPIDGELLGARLPRRPSTGPPGRGIAVGDPSWGPLFDDGEPVPIQVAQP